MEQKIKSIEYFENGMIKKVEYFDEIPPFLPTTIFPQPQKQPPWTVTKEAIAQPCTITDKDTWKVMQDKLKATSGTIKPWETNPWGIGINEVGKHVGQTSTVAIGIPDDWKPFVLNPIG